MRSFTTVLLATALLAGSALPGQAQSLLGIVGGPDSGALVTLGSGDAGSSGAVNVGVGGGSLVDANVGNGSVASATVGSSGGGLGAEVGLLNDTARIGVGVGGDSLVDVDIGLGGGGNGPGANPGPGGNTPGAGNGNRSIFAGAGSGSGGAGGAGCAGISNKDLERLIQSTRIDGSWSRASNVAVQRVALCPEQRSWLASALPASSVGQQLQSAVASDDLLSASLSRTSYSPDRVLAVRRDGSQLTVFVY
jgi:hypothetical protein